MFVGHYATVMADALFRWVAVKEKRVALVVALAVFSHSVRTSCSLPLPSGSTGSGCKPDRNLALQDLFDQ